MELEGFGASLVGRVVYVVADEPNAWLPNEFLSGTQYSVRILITGEGHGVRLLEAENAWNAIFRPANNRDWSVIATMIRSAAGSVLLTSDQCAPAMPSSFISFLDGAVAEGRQITRVWIGTHHEIPAVPDAILFPPLRDPFRATAAYEMIRRLPGRDGHGPWSPMGAAEWATVIEATSKSDLGVLISDVGERAWTLFWHKLSDSVAESHGVSLKRGLCWLRTGAAILEKNHSTQ
jgi:hypothetical protein